MAPKKLWRPVKEWVPREWATMHEAWSRIFASLSNNMPLTKRDLKADLLAGRLVGAARVFNKKEGTEQFIVFEREFWKPVEFPYAWNVTGWGEHYREGEEWYFFVRRRELDKRYPAAANAPPSERPADSLFNNDSTPPFPRLRSGRPTDVAGPRVVSLVPPQARDGTSKPGSADAWIDHLFPKGEWRLMTARRIHKAIVKDGKTRGWEGSPSYSAVAEALKRRT